MGGRPIRLRPSKTLVITQAPDGYSIDRYAADGATAGDTWHPTFDEAIGQAAWEFGDLVGEWSAIPEGEGDPISFVRRIAEAVDQGEP